MLLKLFLGGRLSPGEIRGHVQQFKEEQTQLLLGYADIERRLRREEAQQPHLPYWMMTLRYGQRRAAALTAWADETLRALGRVRPAAAPRATQSRRKRRWADPLDGTSADGGRIGRRRATPRRL